MPHDIQAFEVADTVCERNLCSRRANSSCLRPMKPTEQRYLVDDAEVTLAHDELGARWTCASCEGGCQHILRAAAWLTVESWKDREPAELH